MSRIAELKREDMTDAQKKVAEAITAGPRGAIVGPFNALLRSPELADRAQKLGEFLRYNTSFPPRLSELAILVTARYWTAQYEWWAHSRMAKEGGLAPDIIEAIKNRRRPDFANSDEEAVYDFASEIYQTHGVSDAAYGRVVELFGETGAAEIVGLCGYYALVSMTLNVFQVPVPPGEALPLDD
tara:strand:- start:668 stop:1219 length:552 start_codon:yes stop_codon:yes gene_type:complete